MTIFDYIKDITVNKQGNLPLDQYTPFLVNRWLSFISPEISLVINNFNNKTMLEDKELHYKTMISLFPKLKYAPRIQYIKKLKQELESNSEQEKQIKINLMSQLLELSKKEISNLLSMHPVE